MKAARERLDSPIWRILLVFSCVLVFSFAFHAKVAGYHHPGHVDNATSAKLWLTGDKPQTRASLSDTALLWFVAWFSLVVASSSFSGYQEHRRRPVPLPLNLRNLRRHLRPPPRS